MTKFKYGKDYVEGYVEGDTLNSIIVLLYESQLKIGGSRTLPVNIYEAQETIKCFQDTILAAQEYLNLIEYNNKLLEEYKIDNRIIVSPGKFEGGAIYSPYFYDLYLSGSHDLDDGKYLYFNLTDVERAMFPELENVKTLKMYEDTYGFVYIEIHK